MTAQRSPKWTRVGPLDFLLSSACGLLATYSVGASIARPTVGNILIVGILLGTAFSYIISQTRLPNLRIAPFFYLAAAIFAIAGTRWLNTLLPEEGFPWELLFTGSLCWMVFFGSWVAWSDSTLLFQAVPCISLFALVGAIDTFKGSTLAFFAFLLCAAVLFARAYHRVMLRKAEDSGYADMANIREGPWKWIAGPGWALASASIVVLISLIGAPVIRQSVQAVAGAVPLPTPPTPPPGRSAIGAALIPTALRIGQGPRQLSENRIFRAKLDEPRYLRAATYHVYTGIGWSRSGGGNAALGSNWEGLQAARRRTIRSPNMMQMDFAISLDTPFIEQIPVPGEVIELTPPMSWQFLPDGTVITDAMLPTMSRIYGQAAVPREDFIPRGSLIPIPDFLGEYADPNNVPQKVAELADSITSGLTSDYEKAMAIKNEIERRCVYNLRAEPTPAGADPVNNFLFGEKREGYCDLFASAMALMARSQGIPARVATGYFPVSGERDASGWYILRESDAHAWAELYFEDVGWIPFDPTEGADSVSGGERGQPTLELPLYERAWFQWTFKGTLAGIAMLGIWLLVASYVSYKAGFKIETLALARAYDRFGRAVQKATRRQRRFFETPTEYVQAVNGQLGAAYPLARDLTERFEIAFYANGHPQKSSAADLEAQVAQLEKTLRRKK
jgi:hypothetical protein